MSLPINLSKTDFDELSSLVMAICRKSYYIFYYNYATVITLYNLFFHLYKIYKDRNLFGVSFIYARWSPDPTVRHTVWTQVVGFFFQWLGMFGANQMVIQRYNAVGSNKEARRYSQNSIIRPFSFITCDSPEFVINTSY